MPLPFTDKRVLLTGSGGSIGSALAKKIVTHRPSELILLDHSEGNLHQLDVELECIAGRTDYSAILGDVTDADLLEELLDDLQPEIVIHAAAHKHVPLMETNVLAAVRNNLIGTNRLARVAASHGTRTVLLVSTDKAVNPKSVMGATKRAAELAVLRWSCGEDSMRAVRLGNVLESQGSVVPTFRQQIARGGPITLTHPHASRFFFSMEEAVELIVLAAVAEQGCLFVPAPRAPVLIRDLASQMLRETGADGEIPIRMTGLRPGDKLTEEFVSPQEIVCGEIGTQLRLVRTPQPIPHEFDDMLDDLTACVEERDVAGALAGLCRLIPEYVPSETALASVRKQEPRLR